MEAAKPSTEQQPASMGTVAEQNKALTLFIGFGIGIGVGLLAGLVGGALVGTVMWPVVATIPGAIIGPMVGFAPGAVMGFMVTAVSLTTNDADARLRRTAAVAITAAVIASVAIAAIDPVGVSENVRPPLYLFFVLMAGLGLVILTLWANRLLVNFLYRFEPDQQLRQSALAPPTRWVLPALSFGSIVMAAVFYVVRAVQ